MKVHNLGTLTGDATGTQVPMDFRHQGTKGVMKIDWEVNSTAGGAAVDIEVKAIMLGNESLSTGESVGIAVDGTDLSFDETDFGSPGSTGTYSIYREVYMTPSMQAVVSGSNNGTNEVSVRIYG